MIRWSFHFNEGSVFADILTQEEDERIATDVVDSCDGILYISGEEMAGTAQIDLYVMMSQVKCVTRSPTPAPIEPKEQTKIA